MKTKNISNFLLINFLLGILLVSCSEIDSNPQVSTVDQSEPVSTILPLNSPVETVIPTVEKIIPTPTIDVVIADQSSQIEEIASKLQDNIEISIDHSSKARYKIGEELVRLPLPITATGETGSVSGSIYLDKTGKVSNQSNILVDVTALKSDEDRRDRWVLRNSGIGQEVSLQIQQISGLPWPLPDDGTETIEIIGDLTISGISKTTQWETDLIFNASEVSGLGSTVITWDEFNLSKPTFPFIISLEDEITLEIEFLAYIY